MRVGLHFPGAEIGTDAGLIVEWAHLATDLGFSHVAFGDHVLGVDPKTYPGWAGLWVIDPDVQFSGQRPPYTYEDQWHEPFVTMGFLAALTPIELSTCVMVGPLRRTAVLAKQAAQVDILSGGRLRLALGVGWNSGEFAAVGADFKSRGRMLDEQIPLLRQLWTEPLVNFDGEYHELHGAGLAPLPIQRPIPLWIGGFSPAAQRRAGRLADGYVAGTDPEASSGLMDAVRQAAEDAGRDAGSIGFETTRSPTPLTSAALTNAAHLARSAPVPPRSDVSASRRLAPW